MNTKNVERIGKLTHPYIAFLFLTILSVFLHIPEGPEYKFFNAIIRPVLKLEFEGGRFFVSFK